MFLLETTRMNSDTWVGFQSLLSDFLFIQDGWKDKQEIWGTCIDIFSLIAKICGYLIRGKAGDENVFIIA